MTCHSLKTILAKLLIFAAITLAQPSSGTAFSNQCDIIEAEISRILTPSSPKLKAAIAKTQATIAKLPILVRRRIIKEIKTVKFDSMHNGALRTTHSIANFLIGIISEDEKFMTAWDFFAGNRDLPDGLYLHPLVRGHPSGEISLVHELSHMTRAYNWLGRQSSRYMLKTNLTKNGIIREESLAIGDEYDFIKETYPASEIPQLLAKYSNTGIADKDFYSLHIRAINISFTTRLKDAHKLTRDEYIQLRLKSYTMMQSNQDALNTQTTAFNRRLFAITNALFGE